MPQYAEGSPQSDLATSELKPQYAKSWPTWPTSPRAREYLSTLRTQLGSDLATSERIPQYDEDSTWSDLAMSERIPQYAEDSTRIRPHYERENTSVRWGFNLILPRYERENISWTQLNHFILLMSVRWELNLIILFYLCYVEVSLRPTSARSFYILLVLCWGLPQADLSLTISISRSPLGRPQVNHLTCVLLQSPSGWPQLNHFTYLILRSPSDRPHMVRSVRPGKIK